MTNLIKIGKHIISENSPTFIIAEAGSNHNGNLSIAKEMVKKAYELGCDCIKFQTYTAEEFCADKTKKFTYKSQGKEVTVSEFEMFKNLEFSKNEWLELMEYCKKIGILFLTTVQDKPNLNMMLKLGLKGIKVGSDDFDNLPNIIEYAKSGLPLILSKGMATVGEVDRILNTVSQYTSKLIVLHCVSLYPTEASLLNISQIITLKKLYPEIIWGFSDHSIGPLASIISVSLGAKVIEKHFTLDHDLPGPDHWFSLDTSEMKELVDGIRFAEKAIGNGKINPSQKELEVKKIMRRRVVAARNIRPGEHLSEETVKFKRSDKGSFLENWNLMVGQKVKNNIPENTGIELSDLIFS